MCIPFGSILDSAVLFEETLIKLKSATLCLQTAHSISLSPTRLSALVKQLRHRVCLHGFRTARLEGCDTRQTEQSTGRSSVGEVDIGFEGIGIKCGS